MDPHLSSSHRPPHRFQPRHSEMENPIPVPPLHDDPPASLWDWSDFLDFNLDDQLNVSIDFDQPPAEPEPPPIDPNLGSSASMSDKVRKRDPRLTCSNFIAGLIPCACPELDEKLEEEGLPGKKRARSARSAADGTVRCQVPDCKADISELKGYHRRHRVCLQCANAVAVVLDGQRKRYCQQCGKFHILSDFDEGKRSCRRKLERHNNRRRRKPGNSGLAAERESSQGPGSADDVACDDENAKDGICMSNQIAEREPLLESEEGRISTLCSNPGSQGVQNDSVTILESGGAQVDGEKDEPNYALSSSYHDKKNVYSSPCPSGRISFKLYDWNPAEFPRRLRHQIFQWLASMPVELEGYIRPGCTILTIFVAMPEFMWLKLLEDPVVYIRNFVAAPEKMLSGRGTLLVYLDNVIFRVVSVDTGETPVTQVKVEERVPKLHYVHPTCFEAGKPMEFVACGSNLLQPKFRFLVSFAGKYLAYDCCFPPRHSDSELVTSGVEHQQLKIYIPHTEPDLFGPAFIEVENESGLSNFIPILIGNKEICSEMEIMEQKFEPPHSLKRPMFMATSSFSDSCEVSVLRQPAFSQFILDAAWLLREPKMEDIELILTSFQIGRFNRLLDFLIHNKSISILERVLHYMETMMDKMKLCNTNVDNDIDMELLWRNLNHAREILCQRLREKPYSVQHSRIFGERGDCLSHSSRIDMLPISFADQDMEKRERGNLDAVLGLNSEDLSANLPLLNREVALSGKSSKQRTRKSRSRLYSNRYLVSRPLLFAVAAAAVCFGICAVLLHPQQVGKIATTIRRCLFDNT